MPDDSATEVREWLADYLANGQPRNAGPFGGERRHYRLAGERLYAYLQRRHGASLERARALIVDYLEAHGGYEDVMLVSRDREVTGARGRRPPRRYTTLVVPVDALE